MTFDFFDSGLTYMLRLGLTPSSIKFSFIDSHLMFFARQCLHNNLPDCSCIYSNAYFFRGSCNKPGILKNGRVIGRNYSDGSVIKFECNKGYEVRGSTCRRGSWEGQFPECESKFKRGVNNEDNFDILTYLLPLA